MGASFPLNQIEIGKLGSALEQLLALTATEEKEIDRMCQAIRGGNSEAALVHALKIAEIRCPADRGRAFNSTDCVALSA